MVVTLLLWLCYNSAAMEVEQGLSCSKRLNLGRSEHLLRAAEHNIQLLLTYRRSYVLEKRDLKQNDVKRIQ